MADSNFDQKYFDLTNADPYIQEVARPGQTIVRKSPYQYPVIIGTAALPLTRVAGTVTATLVTLADSDFVLTSLASGVNLSANGDLKFNRNLTLQIQDTSNGKYFFQAPTVTSLCTGGGGFPLELPAPRVIRPNTTLLFQGLNRDATTDYYQMFVVLGGFRLFYATNQ